MTASWVIVTGASRGIGRSTAIEASRRGYAVSIWARSGDDLDVTASLCRGPAVDVKVVDLASWESSVAAGAGFVSTDPERHIAGLVLNAGIGCWSRLSDMTPAPVERQIGLNLVSPIATLHALHDRLVSSRSAVVGIGSDSAYRSDTALRSVYAATKAGLAAVLRALQAEAPELRSSYIYLGQVDTYFRGKKPGDRPGGLHPDVVGRQVLDIIESHRSDPEIHLGP